MYRSRVIPCLLLSKSGLVKTKKFKESKYIGDPVNAVRIFSEKEVDELVILDIDASKSNNEPNYELITEIAGECFMPIAYGGGIKTLKQVKQLIRCGVEKVVINTEALASTNIIKEVSNTFGSQAMVVAIDVSKNIFGSYKIYSHSKNIQIKMNLDDYIHAIVAAGAGEIFLNNVDRDGTMKGYDIDLISHVSSIASVPVVACGGANSLENLRLAINSGGASAVSAGSLFVYHGKHRAVLINYPECVIL